MGSFIAEQPSGPLCCFSSVVDAATDYDLTDEEYIEICVEKAREETREVLKHHIRPFNCIEGQSVPSNMNSKEFKQIIKKMETLRERKKYSIALHLHCFCFAVAKVITIMTTDLSLLQPEGKNTFQRFRHYQEVLVQNVTTTSEKHLKRLQKKRCSRLIQSYTINTRNSMRKGKVEKHTRKFATRLLRKVNQGLARRKIYVDLVVGSGTCAALVYVARINKGTSKLEIIKLKQLC